VSAPFNDHPSHVSDIAAAEFSERVAKDLRSRPEPDPARVSSVHHMETRHRTSAADDIRDTRTVVGYDGSDTDPVGLVLDAHEDVILGTLPDTPARRIAEQPNGLQRLATDTGLPLAVELRDQMARAEIEAIQERVFSNYEPHPDPDIDAAVRGRLIDEVDEAINSLIADGLVELLPSGEYRAIDPTAGDQLLTMPDIPLLDGRHRFVELVFCRVMLSERADTRTSRGRAEAMLGIRWGLNAVMPDLADWFESNLEGYGMRGRLPVEKSG
jgi:hypothetical protein